MRSSWTGSWLEVTDPQKPPLKSCCGATVPWSSTSAAMHSTMLQDAEDAFQTVFLVLAQRASSIRRRVSIAGWLYGVAHRVASRARSRAARRRGLEERMAGRTAEQYVPPGDDPEWQVLHDEIDRLPEQCVRAAGTLLPGRLDLRSGGAAAWALGGDAARPASPGTKTPAPPPDATRCDDSRGPAGRRRGNTVPGSSASAAGCFYDSHCAGNHVGTCHRGYGAAGDQCHGVPPAQGRRAGRAHRTWKLLLGLARRCCWG